MRIHVFDNYDSFTGNLVHYLEVLSGSLPKVWPNDAPDFSELFQADALVLSPGPGLPETSGQLMPLLKHLPSDLPVLGVCLGMQALGQLCGANLEQLKEVVHGQSDALLLAEPLHPLFAALQPPIQVGRYHSWAFRHLPAKHWRVLASAADGSVMAAVHLHKPWTCLQFHPESVMSPQGFRMLANWLAYACPQQAKHIHSSWNFNTFE